MEREKIYIPLMDPIMALPEREFPISKKDNLMKAFRHEKPVWMPILTHATQWVFPDSFKDMPPGGPHGTMYDPNLPASEQKTTADWFGVLYKSSGPADPPINVKGIFNEIGEWKEKMHFPDLEAIDWAADAKDFQRAPDLALATRLGSGIFERLHMCEGFEQCLVDIISEPEECKEFFDRVGQYKIDSFRHMHEVFKFDYIISHDDWATARAQFFSAQTFEETLLECTVKLADTVKKAGCAFMSHCCGKMEAWLPYFVNEIHADALEIQPINDIRGILDKWGGQITPSIHTDPYIMYDPDVKEEDIRAYARSIVDKYGAQTCDGSGAIVYLGGSIPALYYAFEDELFNYSYEKYANLK